MQNFHLSIFFTIWTQVQWSAVQCSTNKYFCGSPVFFFDPTSVSEKKSSSLVSLWGGKRRCVGEVWLSSVEKGSELFSRQWCWKCSGEVPLSDSSWEETKVSFFLVGAMSVHSDCWNPWAALGLSQAWCGWRVHEALSATFMASLGHCRIWYGLSQQARFSSPVQLSDHPLIGWLELRKPLAYCWKHLTEHHYVQDKIPSYLQQCISQVLCFTY